MRVVKRIVCLANSRKLSGRCVAGREVATNGTPGRWIRPISSRHSEEVSEHERQYQDGSDPRVLDLIDVPLLGSRPTGYQQENWLLDPQSYWVRSGMVGWQEIMTLRENPSHLWIDGNSTYHGANDRMTLETALTLENSLTLVHVPGLRLRVFAPSRGFGDPKRRVQAHFQISRTPYRLWVTDPGYEREYLRRADGLYDVGESLLTVSLGEPYEGHVYKLVAAIIERGRTEGGES